MNLEKLEKLASLAEKYDYKPDESHFNNLAAFVGVNSSLIADLCKEYTTLQREITNAQEALKSAGIEADTVQAGVMELVAQNAALVAEVVNMREQAEDVYAAGYRHGHLNTADGVAYAPSVEDEFYHNALQVMAEVETPATDAYLNAVRAEGVEMFARQQRAIAAVTHGTAFLVHRRFAVGVAEDFAAQLRAGNDDKSALMMKAGKLVKASEEDSRQVSEFMRAAETPGDQLRAGNAGKDGSHE